MQAKLDYEASKQILAECLRRDALLQEENRLMELGEKFEELDASLSRDSEQLAIAWTFWDSWIDERNHRFPEFYKGIKRDMWPILARHIADRLAGNQTITDPLILKYFEIKPKLSFLKRVMGLFKHK